VSADLLRRAAALMRERAEAATPGPWHGFPPEAPAWSQQVVWAGQATVAEVSMPIPPEFGLDGLADRDHIASWHPAVALAVADWLDRVVASHHAEVDEVCFDECDECIPGADCQGHDRECCAYCNGSSDEGYVTRILFGRCTPFLDAIAVAKAYLGGDA